MKQEPTEYEKAQATTAVDMLTLLAVIPNLLLDYQEVLEQQGAFVRETKQRWNMAYRACCNAMDIGCKVFSRCNLQLQYAGQGDRLYDLLKDKSRAADSSWDILATVAALTIEFNNRLDANRYRFEPIEQLQSLKLLRQDIGKTYEGYVLERLKQARRYEITK